MSTYGGDPLDSYDRPGRNRPPVGPILKQRYRPVVVLDQTGQRPQRHCNGSQGLEDFPIAEMLEMVLQAAQLQRLAVEGHPLGRYETRAVAQ
ncbi:MAG: hypothetical protein M3Y91_06640 [Actinomycetota bacterium]|nr:hypothetical protein [Actinomycetota bacterium]